MTNDQDAGRQKCDAPWCRQVAKHERFLETQDIRDGHPVIVEHQRCRLCDYCAQEWDDSPWPLLPVKLEL